MEGDYSFYEVLISNIYLSTMNMCITDFINGLDKVNNFYHEQKLRMDF